MEKFKNDNKDKKLKNQIKAIFFDIDGTLVSFKTHLVPDSTRQALEKLREKGIKCYIASGRSIKSINNLPGLEFDGYVTINGTLTTLYNPEPQVIYRHPIPQEDVKRWLNYLDDAPRSTVFVGENGLLMNFANEEMKQIFELLNFPEPPIGNLNNWTDETVYQIITTFPTSEEDEIMSHLPHCKTTRWHPLFTDIIEKNASKAQGIRALIDFCNYKQDEIMAFGDGGNDKEMLQEAGISIAMGNAEQSVKDVANYITDSVDDDGIAKALKHFGLID